MPHLPHSLSTYHVLRERIRAAEQDIDDETLADTLEGLTDLHEVIAAAVRSAVLDEAMANGLKGHISTLEERLRRIGDRAGARRQIARDAMAEAGIRKIVAPDCTISLRPAPPRAVIIDEHAVPDDFLKPQPPKLDRLLILEALKRGDPVPGATLSNPESTLSVRSK